MTTHRTALALVAALAAAAPVAGQLDPLLFLKSARPHVLIALDLSSRMQHDLSGAYRDPRVYRPTGAAWEASLRVRDSAVDEYRRAYPGLLWLEPGGEVRATAESVAIVGDRDPLFATFDAGTRLGIARAGVATSVAQNRRSVAFGLLHSRQQAAAFNPAAPARLRVTAWPGAAAPTDAAAPAEWYALLGDAAGPGGSAPPAPPRVAADAPGANGQLLQLLARNPLDADALVPAGLDTAAFIDAPLLRLLEDVHAEAARLIDGDSGCRNTIVVLIAAGDQAAALDPPLDQLALDFLRLHGRRVPIHVVALAPDSASAARLARVASVTGGAYVEVPAPAALGGSEAEQAAHAVARAVNLAVQHGCARFADVNTLPSSEHPLGPLSEYTVAAPVVGTVNLEGARGAHGQELPYTRVTTREGVLLPQASNVVVTAGFALPGFTARLRAFRVYRPDPDPTAVQGYRFVADGTPLWTAAAPPPDRRNIFTVVPGLGVVPFTGDNAPLLAPYLGATDAAGLIRLVRGLPLGAITNSTPALLTPPAEGFADPDYRAFAEANQHRRSLFFLGADDGMVHAVDGRTGVEVWAVVPFNLLPRLRLLEDGQPIDDHRYYVGGSGRLADVRTAAGWATLLTIGEGPGGTFYQSFDVTLSGIAEAVPPGTDDVNGLLGWFSDRTRIPFLWSFPSYVRFDHTIAPHGDISAGATAAEKSVGETWSTPSAFRLGPGGRSVLLVGSGPLPARAERQPNRGRTPAGTTMYLLDAGSGAVLDTRFVGDDGVGEDEEACGASGCAGLKNALAADPAVLLLPGTPPARAYLGDLDGRLWRAEVQEDAGGTRFSGQPRLLLEGAPTEPLFASVGLLRPGLDRTLLFLGTGSDLASPGGASPPGRLLTIEETHAGVTTRSEVLLATAASGAEERVSSLPAAVGDIFLFSTSFVGGSACEAGSGRLYALDLWGGLAYDWNRDGRRDAGDAVCLEAPAGGRVTPPIVADRHVFLASADRLQVFGDPGGFNQGPGFRGVRLLSWRELRD